MDFVDGYYTEEARLAMNSSIYVVTVGDLRPPPHSNHYRRHRDIVIPSSTHLLNSYFLNPRDYVDEFGNPLPILRGTVDARRQIQAVATGVEIFQPSQSTGIGSVDRKKKESNFLRNVLSRPPKRDTTAIFRGGIGRPGEGESYSLEIRSLFFPSKNTTTASSHPGFSSLPSWDIAIASENDDYAVALSRSKFGLAPPGYTLDTTRIWEYLAFGVVPVFIGTGPTGGQVMPFADDFDYSSFSISVSRERAHLLPAILAAMNKEEYERLRKNAWTIGRLLVLEAGQGNVLKWLQRDLCRLRAIGRKTDEIQYT
ncbi:hypothetical protein P7C70_g1307, partial [Phenoliferia sp. Uapishka_3]